MKKVPVESNNGILWGETRNRKVVCVYVCEREHTHTLKIGVHLNMLKRGTEIHRTKKEELKTIAREVETERRL